MIMWSPVGNFNGYSKVPDGGKNLLVYSTMLCVWTQYSDLPMHFCLLFVCHSLPTTYDLIFEDSCPLDGLARATSMAS